MKVIYYYLLLAALLGCLVYVPTRYEIETEKESIVSGYQFQITKDPATSLFSRFAYDDERLNIFPTYRSLAMVEVYLAATKTPFMRSVTPRRFIQSLQQRNTKFQIRNGELEALEANFALYLETLNDFLCLVDEMGGDPMLSKQQFNQQLEQKAKQAVARKSWATFKQKRKLVWKSFRQFRAQLKMTYETEKALINQYLYHQHLFDSLNGLWNTNNERLAIYVYTQQKLFHGNWALGDLAGLVVITKENGLFSSDTPTIRRDYPSFTGKKNHLAVFLREGANGATVSHEFGHLYYLYHHWDQYMDFIKKKGKCYVIGGHGIGDPSGEAAILAELGKMPRIEKSVDPNQKMGDNLITAAAAKRH